MKSTALRLVDAYCPLTLAIGKCMCEDLANKRSMSPVKLTRIAIDPTASNIPAEKMSGRYTVVRIGMVSPGDHCSKYGYSAHSVLLCGEYYTSMRELRCTLREEKLCGKRADW